jgi:hypothetical protein
MKAPQLELYFESAAQRTELTKTRFIHPLLSAERVAVRGKMAGAIFESGTFQWTKGVQALARLLIAALAASGAGDADLGGTRGSLAAALDEAVHKGSLWLIDMFGMDGSGVALAKRLLLRSNPGLRRPGPVCLSLNRTFLPPAKISVILNGKPLTTACELEHLDTRLAALERRRENKVASMDRFRNKRKSAPAVR